MIEKIAKLYNDFQRNYGQSKEIDYQSIVLELFAKDLQKIANSNVLVSARSGLLDQLGNVKNIAEKWDVIEEKVIPSLDQTQVTIQYKLETVKAGNFGVIAILTINDKMKICRIEEVFCQLA